MPRADDFEPGDRFRLPHTDYIVDVLDVERYFNRTTLIYQTSIGHVPGRFTCPPHMELEECT